MAGQEAVGTRDQGAPADDRQKARDLPERVEREKTTLERTNHRI